MRKDESGAACPETLGEYRDLCAAIGGPECEAVKLLDSIIAKEKAGRETVVIKEDSQMRALLMPLLVPPRPTSKAPPVDAAAAANHARQRAGTLSMWTVYESPKDYPGKFVARRWDTTAGQVYKTTDVLIEDRVEKLRHRFEHMGLYCLPAQPGDDPVIVETWI